MSSGLVCPKCGSDNAEGQGRCAVCEQPLRPTDGVALDAGRCARCGTAVPGEHRFCPICGLDRQRRLARPQTRSFRVAFGGDRDETVAASAPLVEEAAQRDSIRDTGHDGPCARIVRLRRDGSEGRAFEIGSRGLVLGRQGADVCFPDDAFLSPKHVRVTPNDDGFSVEDLGSHNGVYLRLRGAEPVYPGDHFLLGHEVFRLDPADAPAAASTAPGVETFATALEPAWGKLSLCARPGSVGDAYHLRTPEVVIGREAGDLVFGHDQFLSRQHARLCMRERGGKMMVVLEDLGSANGTYLRLRGSAEVRNNDVIRVGDQLLRLQEAKRYG